MMNNMKGWIKLHRKIMENPLWEDKPFSKGQAFVDLLIMANHAQETLIYGNTIIELDRGQFHTSEAKLMTRWGWSKKKVRSYLSLLERLKMATAHGTIKGTTITIENYGIYQGEGTTEDIVEGTVKEPQRNREGYTNKNIKNIKNVKKERNNSTCVFSPPSLNDVKAYCAERMNHIDADAFIDYYTRQGWILGNGKPMAEWKSSVRSWERRDKKKFDIENSEQLRKAANRKRDQEEQEQRIALMNKENTIMDPAVREKTKELMNKLKPPYEK